MGTQQLLLLTVAFIVVGLMLYSAIDIAYTYLENSNRDQLISTIHDIGILAQIYYKKDHLQGGGGGKYTGWEIPLQLKNTQAGTFSASVKEDRVDLSANGTEIGRNETTVVRITARVDNNGIRVTIVN